MTRTGFEPPQTIEFHPNRFQIILRAQKKGILKGLSIVPTTPFEILEQFEGSDDETALHEELTTETELTHYEVERMVEEFME